MGTKIKVTPALLVSTASRIESLASDYKKQYDLMYSETGAMAAEWGGKDNLAFIEQISGFKDDFEKMRSLMTSYADFLRKSAKSYSDTQTTIVNNAKRLTN